MLSRGSPVERYYERNTRRFLRFGGGGASGAIHRLLWGPDVTSTSAAARYVNVLVADALHTQQPTEAMPGPPIVLDLGCGVGGTAIELAAAMTGARVRGVTLSPTQCELARAAAARAGVGDRCTFQVANFETMRLDLTADAAIAIESFVHSADPAAFFATAAAHLRPGGRLIVIDDFLADRAADDAGAARLARRFRSGWRAPSFMPRSDCVAVAAAAGLTAVAERDLGELIRLNRPRDRLIAALAPALGALGLSVVPFCGNLIGGNALRTGLARGVFTYRWLEFRRQSA